MVGVIVNIESQKDDKKPYPMEKRAVYYASRLISAQKEVIFRGQDYQKIRKVYSIWIQINVPEEKKNTLSLYRMKEDVIMGKYKTQKTNYDLMTIVMIRLGKYDDKTENKLVDKNITHEFLALLEILNILGRKK